MKAPSIATPCNADWDKMKGDERVRFCGRCNKNVYNLSDMSRDEAEQLLAQNELNLCVTFFQRPDGTLVTSRCPTYRRPNYGVAAGALIAVASLTWALPTAEPGLRRPAKKELVRGMGGVLGRRLTPMKPLPEPKSEVPNRLGDEPIFASPQQWMARNK